MKQHIYLSLFPEALILSQLQPVDFGYYLAGGKRQHARGQALFFEVDPSFAHSYFRLDEGKARCVPHEDGSPKNSVYVSIYKVLENIPLDVIGQLFLVTEEGHTLALSQGKAPPSAEKKLWLYQELCPKRTMVASRLAPAEFGGMLTAPDQPLWLPKVVFCDLELGELSKDPTGGSSQNLPYPQMEHLRDCLGEIQKDPNKSTKTVFRALSASIFYRTVESGFYLASAEGILHYPMPERSEMETTYYPWWRSAARGTAI